MILVTLRVSFFMAAMALLIIMTKNYYSSEFLLTERLKGRSGVRQVIHDDEKVYWEDRNGVYKGNNTWSVKSTKAEVFSKIMSLSEADLEKVSLNGSGLDIKYGALHQNRPDEVKKLYSALTSDTYTVTYTYNANGSLKNINLK